MLGIVTGLLDYHLRNNQNFKNAQNDANTSLIVSSWKCQGESLFVFKRCWNINKVKGSIDAASMFDVGE